MLPGVQSGRVRGQQACSWVYARVGAGRMEGVQYWSPLLCHPRQKVTERTGDPHSAQLGRGSPRASTIVTDT